METGCSFRHTLLPMLHFSAAAVRWPTVFCVFAAHQYCVFVGQWSANRSSERNWQLMVTCDSVVHKSVGVASIFGLQPLVLPHVPQTSFLFWQFTGMVACTQGRRLPLGCRSLLLSQNLSAAPISERKVLSGLANDVMRVPVFAGFSSCFKYMQLNIKAPSFNASLMPHISSANR